MENETAVKGIVATIMVVLAYLYDSVGVLFIILLMAMATDYITGIFSALVAGELNSRTGIIGILKKVSYMGLVLMAFLFDLAIINTVEQAGMRIPLQSIFGVLVTAWLFGNEAISIMENLGEIGVPIPPFFKDGLKVFKKWIEKLNKKGDGE